MKHNDPTSTHDSDTQEDTFQTEQVLTVAGGHFIHDTFTAFLPVLLPILKARLNVSYTLAGSLAIFTQLPSLLNPLIGYFSDRFSVRYLIILAPAVTATLMSLLGLVNNYTAAVVLLLAVGVSVSAFHAPAPALIGRVSGNKIGRGMSYFMASGELGRTIGPLLATAAIVWFTVDGKLTGIWKLAFIGWMASAVLYFRLRDLEPTPRKVGEGALPNMWPKAIAIFPVIIWLSLARVFLLVSITTYLPTYMQDVAHVSFKYAGRSLAILEAAGMVGALFSGTLSDKLGRFRILFVLLSLSPFLLLLLTQLSGLFQIFVFIALGLTAISPTPVLLALVQEQFTENRAFANGIFIGINFLVRSIGIFAVGRMGDTLGLQSAFIISAGLALNSIPAVWVLSRRLRPTH